MFPTPPCFPLLGFCLRVFSAGHKDLSYLHGAQSVLGSTYVSRCVLPFIVSPALPGSQ